MSEQLIHTKVEPPTIRRSRPGLLGQKPPLKIKEIWAIRIRLQLEERIRDLAMFNLAIDSKLRACDLTALTVDDVAMSGRVRSRAIVIQKKTGRSHLCEAIRTTGVRPICERRASTGRRTPSAPAICTTRTAFSSQERTLDRGPLERSPPLFFRRSGCLHP